MKVGMSKTRSIGVLILFSAIILSGAVLLASAITPPPNKFSGDVTLNGTDAPPGTIIEAFIDGEPRGSIVVESPGKYEYLTVAGSASDDGMPVTFTVGGLSASTDRPAIWTAMIDHVQVINLVAGDVPAGDITPPDITITTPASDASFTTATITVSGTASDESLDKVQVKVGYSGNWIDATGTASWSTTVTLDRGLNTIYARANDTSGNSREVQVGNVSYLVGGSEDTTPPTVSIDSPSNGDAFTTTTITVSGTAYDTEGISKVQVNVGSGDWMDATGTKSWSKTVTTSHGMHTIEVRAIDTTGNPSEMASITVACNPPSSGGSSSRPGGSVIAPRATPTGTDAQPVSGNVTSVTSTSTITEANTSVTTSTKEPATKPETKGLPGFEVVSAIAGLLAVAYMLIRRSSK